MKTIKKIIKVVAVVGTIAALVKTILKIVNMNKRMSDYNNKAVFNGMSKKYEEEPFEKDSVAGMFSGIDLDFKKAKMLGQASQLDILGRFSGISVKVPDTWHVEMDGTAVQSGISERYEDNSEVEGAPKLQINYDIKYCGLDVSNPKEEEEIEALEEVLPVEDIVEDPSEFSEETKKVVEDFEENFGHEEVLEESQEPELDSEEESPVDESQDDDEVDAGEEDLESLGKIKLTNEEVNQDNQLTPDKGVRKSVSDGFILGFLIASFIFGILVGVCSYSCTPKK